MNNSEKDQPAKGVESAFGLIFGGAQHKETKIDSSMLLFPYYEQARRAHNGTSFSPELRGKSLIKEYSEDLQAYMDEIGGLGGDVEKFKEKYISLFTSWLGSKSRCISTMITGGSNFPTRRADKYNNWERSASDKFHDFRTYQVEKLKKAKRRVIRDNENTVEGQKAKLAKLEANQERMKSANKIIKSKKMSEVEKVDKLVEIMGITEPAAKLLFQPDFCGRIGFASYQLTNNNATIKNTKARIAELERRETTENKDQQFGEVTLTINAADNRVQIFFPDKPAKEIRSMLKERAMFRWSPSNGCWQGYMQDHVYNRAKEIIHEYNRQTA